MDLGRFLTGFLVVMGVGVWTLFFHACFLLALLLRGWELARQGDRSEGLLGMVNVSGIGGAHMEYWDTC